MQEPGVTQEPEQKTLPEHLRELVANSVGDIDLTPLIERAMDDVFFKPRSVRTSTYGPSTEMPPLLHEIVKELLQERMTAEVRDWLRSHEEEVMGSVEQVVREGAGQAAVRGFTDFFNHSMMMMQNDIIQRLSRNL